MSYFKQRLIETIFSILMRFIECDEYEELEWNIKAQIERKTFEKVERFIDNLIKEI